MSEKHNSAGTEITINDDDTLTVAWVGKRGNGSLFHLAAEGNAKHVNKLDADEIWAVMACARQVPYPGQRRAKVYELVLRAIREVPEKVFPEGRPNTTLGKLRHALVMKIGSSFGDVFSEYLEFAANLKEPATV